MSARKDITGHRYGRVLVESFAFVRSRNAHWKCVCDCGNRFVASACNLKSGATKSCGCYTKEVAREKFTTHGMSKTAEYRSWQAMRDRCVRKNNKAYKYYGGNGIKVCERWESFEMFYEDMGNKPTKAHSIDRVDGRQGYFPENCRWATGEEQANNSTNCHLVTIGTETKNLEGWSKISGIKANTICQRLKYGWSEKDAVFRPLRQRIPLHSTE